MHRSWKMGVVGLIALALPGIAAASEFVGGFYGDLEVGPLYIAQNDNSYGADGTRFGAGDVGQQENLVLSRRLALEVPLSERSALIFVYAPFDVSTRATLDNDLRFNDTVFPADTVVDSRYLFDGYRLSYLYAPVVRERLALQVGASGQIRNAQVAMTAVDGSARALESNIGFVGALKARVFWDPLEAGGPYLLLDADAFSTFGLFGDVKGAIYDVALTLALPVTKSVDLTFRGRLLGGGAEVPDKDIDNWANFAAFTVGARVGLDTLLD